ncbi:MAG: radical SAM protein [Candidatus Odinarchaeia archaeon]
MRREIKLTEGRSYVLGELPEGCKYCIKGSKVVVFITGKCKAECYYCPISFNKKISNQSYVNELVIKTDEDLLREAKLIDAEGAGFTGGDPLINFNKTVRYIKLLKEHFGEQFHIHLYTTNHLLTVKRVDILIESGLDEIRIHPVNGKIVNLNILKDKKIKYGYEIPAIPGEEENIIKLISYLEEINADFININELEFSETNSSNLLKRGFKLKNDSIAAVEGSEETAFKILQWAQKNTSKINIHYCPSILKDGVQLKNRFIRRGKNVKKPYEELDDEGLLTRGVISLSDKNLIKIQRLLVEKYEVPIEFLEIDKENNRILTAWYIAEELSEELNKLGLKVSIEKCYPTDDRFIVLAYEVN